ncbi:MAG TPA: hypothetical protein VIQ04_03830 [Nitrososphaeraceae archaeon]|jgi:hypothetical protein
MNSIPTYYCNNCDHVFSNPDRIGRGFVKINEKDKFNRKPCCPRCSSTEFELLNMKKHDKNMSHIRYSLFTQ